MFYQKFCFIAALIISIIKTTKVIINKSIDNKSNKRNINNKQKKYLNK